MVVDPFLRPGEARVVPFRPDPVIAFDSQATMDRMASDIERWAVRISDGLLIALWPDFREERIAAMARQLGGVSREVAAAVLANTSPG